DELRASFSDGFREKLEAFEGRLTAAAQAVERQALMDDSARMLGPDESSVRLPVRPSEVLDGVMDRRLSVDMRIRTTSAYAASTSQGVSFAGDFFNIPDPGRTLVHEGIHKTPSGRDARLYGWALDGQGHRDEYDRMAYRLLGRRRW